MPCTQDNPKGFFEPLDIVQYHNNLLKTLGLSWDTFLTPPLQWFSSDQANKAILDLTQKIQEGFLSDGPVAIKDPRLCLLLPLWQKIITKMNLQDFYLLPIRHPLEVSASLAKRNNICQSRALLIWLNHVFNAEKFSRGRKRSFLEFPKWVHNIEHTIEKIEKDLGTTFPNKNQESMAKAKNEFEAGLVHHTETSFLSGESPISHFCINIFHCFRKLIDNPSDTDALSEIDQHRKTFETWSSIISQLVQENKRKMSKNLSDMLACV